MKDFWLYRASFAVFFKMRIYFQNHAYKFVNKVASRKLDYCYADFSGGAT